MNADTPWEHTALAYALVLLSPPTAWLIWVRTHDSVSDLDHVAWFVTVALCGFAAGTLASPRWTLFAPLFVLTPAATMTTLYLWWSEDITGLFMVGIIMATPVVLLVGTTLLLLGRAANQHRRRRKVNQPTAGPPSS